MQGGYFCNRVLDAAVQPEDLNLTSMEMTFGGVRVCIMAAVTMVLWRTEFPETYN